SISSTVLITPHCILTSYFGRMPGAGDECRKPRQLSLGTRHRLGQCLDLRRPAEGGGVALREIGPRVGVFLAATLLDRVGGSQRGYPAGHAKWEAPRQAEDQPAQVGITGTGGINHITDRGDRDMQPLAIGLASVKRRALFAACDHR